MTTNTTPHHITPQGSWSPVRTFFVYTATDDSNALGAPGGAGGGGGGGGDEVVVLSIDVGETTFTLPVQRSADYTHVAEKFCAQTGEFRG